MLSFSCYNTPNSINEANKGGHISHLEDGMFEEGYAGLQASIKILKDVANSVSASGKAVPSVNVSTKWDGAPALIVGTHPETKKFFVATKSFFSKTSKVNYTEADIRANHEGGVVDKLILALKYLKPLNIRGIAWGDLLFTQAEKKAETIDGKSYITFRPNTITYAVPANSPTGMEVAAAKFGIVFHTKWSGSGDPKERSSWSPGVPPMGTSTGVWIVDAKVPTLPKNMLLQSAEEKQFVDLVAKIEANAGSMKSALVSFLKSEAAEYVAQYVNATVKAGLSNNTANGLAVFIQSRIAAEVEALKTDAKKKEKQEKVARITKYLKAYASQIDLLFGLHAMIAKAKAMIISKLSLTQTVSTFIGDKDGYRPTAPEGFVAVCGKTCRIVKLVDRNEFSRNNFNLAKEWK
jgi:hypothetical protein